MEDAGDQFAADDQHRPGEPGSSNWGSDPEAREEVMPPQIGDLLAQWPRVPARERTLREPEPHQARQRKQQVEGEPEQIGGLPGW